MHKNEKMLYQMVNFGTAHDLGFLPFGKDGRMIFPLTMATRDLRFLRKQSKMGNSFRMHAKDLVALSVAPEVYPEWKKWMEEREYPVSPYTYEQDERFWMLYRGVEPIIVKLFGFDVDVYGGGVAVVPWSEELPGLANCSFPIFPRKLSAEITNAYDINA